MKCFGDKGKTFHCKVVLLDEQELIQEVQETTIGQDLLDVVFQHLNLIETAYFGLRYIDPSNQTHWLDPNKRLVKQLKGLSPYTLYFSVKFYAADPTKLVEEITRYQFFLQIKQDILQGRLPISIELAAELGSLAVQSELGDYDPRRHSPGYVSEFRFITNQTVPLESKIGELHKKLVSYVPSKAELCYLEKVKWLDMYGVDLHPVLGEDSTEYFLGLTPSGIIVLRNKAKVGNYFWPRITKVYFKGRFFMLRVKDKNNVENTYGFETPSKSACKHLWQCCVEHHAFFRLTQAAGNSPQAMFSIGSKFRYSGRTEKEALNDAKANARPQNEFARTPSRRYQRRIIEGAQDTPRVEDAEHKPETRTVVSLPGTVTPVSHVYRSTSMTLAPRSDSPRSTRSAPHPTGLQRQIHSVLGTTSTTTTKREGRPSTRGESPRSIKSASTGRTPDGAERVPRRTSSVESQSSADSRSCNRSCSRHRRSRCRSSDGESEGSSKCSSSKGHRRHHHHHRHHRRHRHHSDDSSEHHKHRHRRHRHSRSSDKQEPQMIESSDQWAKVQNGDTPSRSNTATVRDLTSGYMPSGHDDTEADTQVHTHSSRRKHRKHRSPSENKKNYPDEIRRHIEYNLQNTEGLTESQLKEIPYTKVETAKNVKIRYGSPKGKRHKSPKRSKSNSSDRKNHEESHQQKSNLKNVAQNGLIEPESPNEDDQTQQTKNENENRIGSEYMVPNGSLRPCPRSNPASMVPVQHTEALHQEECATSQHSYPHTDSSPLKNFQEAGTLQKHRKEKPKNLSPPAYGPKPIITTNHDRNSSSNGNNRSSYSSHTPYSSQDPNMFKTCNYVTSSHHNNNSNNTSESTLSQYPRRNPHSEDVFQPPHRDSTQVQDPQVRYRREEEEEKELGREFVESNGGGFMSQCPTLLKNATTERNSQFTAVLKPQPSPQSSVTSGISVGSSSASTTLAENSEGEFQRHSARDEFPYQTQGHDSMYTNDAMLKKHIDKRQVTPLKLANGYHGININHHDNFHSTQFQKPYVTTNGYVPKENGYVPKENGYVPKENGYVPKENGYIPKEKLTNVENGLTPKDYNKKYYSAFNVGVREHLDDMLIDKGYHTIEKESTVNYRKKFLSPNKKQSKDKPNSLNPIDKRNEVLLNSDYHHKSLEKNNSTPNNDNPRMFKPILKSFASEDNLNSHINIKTRSKSSERLDSVVSFNNNKNRVRWNIQEKNRNMINIRDVNSYCKNRDYSSLNRSKVSNVHNVKNDVVYAGKREIIEIKNNQIINIKTVPQQTTSTSFKKENNSKAFVKDEVSTEL